MYDKHIIEEFGNLLVASEENLIVNIRVPATAVKYILTDLSMKGSYATRGWITVKFLKRMYTLYIILSMFQLMSRVKYTSYIV
eukprot:snap_masked-scaffold_9-processed-gene-4.40-mRNA-1 protein AED:1.00 eAED:1.00 QI:0/0/0/0/1/1/2/0/82